MMNKRMVMMMRIRKRIMMKMKEAMKDRSIVSLHSLLDLHSFWVIYLQAELPYTCQPKSFLSIGQCSQPIQKTRLETSSGHLLAR